MSRKIPENSTPILNEILEALSRARLSIYEFNIIMAVIRKTYGWDKKNDWIAGSQLEELTGIRQNHCYRTVTKLVKKNILIKEFKRVGLNKRTKEWLVPIQVVPIEVVPIQVLKHTHTGTSNIPIEVHTKETIQKKLLQKRVSEFEIFWINYPKKRNKGQAEKAFKKVTEPIESLILVINEAKKTEAWRKEGGQFIPYPASWLNARGWEDEVEVGVEKGDDYYVKEMVSIGVIKFSTKHGKELAMKYSKYSKL
jgi:phage replication O-like protein O